MTTDSPLLSICIPTFNNPEGIRTLLTYVHANNRSVEVCISDNSENTETDSVVRAFVADISVRYVRNEKNVGYDRNVDRVLGLATGTFCWMLSDNEKLQPDALATVLEACRTHSSAGHLVICPPSISATNLRCYPSLETAIIENEYWIPGGLVSRNVFAREMIPDERSAYYGNDWIHLSLAIEIGRAHSVCFIPEVFEDDLNMHCTWAKNGKTFETYTNLLTILTSANYSSSFTDTIGARMRYHLPREILSAKLYGLTLTSGTLRRLKSATTEHPLVFTLSLLALIIPKPILRYAKRIRSLARD